MAQRVPGVNVSDFMTMVEDAGKFVRLTNQPLLPQRNNPGSHFC